jgi:hypothetical protein
MGNGLSKEARSKEVEKQQSEKTVYGRRLTEDGKRLS